MSEPRARRVRVQLRSVQVMDGSRDETKLCASGMLLETADGVRVTYSHKDGGTPMRTTVQTAGKTCVTVTHSGGVRSRMRFEAGKTHQTAYETPYGALTLEIHTHSVENRLDAAGGTLRFSYALLFPAQPAIHNHMTLTVLPSQEEETTGEANDVKTDQRN